MITAEQIIDTVRELCLKANMEVREDIVKSLEQALEEEPSANARFVLEALIENAQIASSEKKPFCQDTGYVTVFFQWGSKVPLTENLAKVCDEGIRAAYEKGYFRKSIVSDPLYSRQNTGDNTPGLLDIEVVPGNEVTVNVLIKGAGSDNASELKMLNPTDGVESVGSLVWDLVQKKGARSCPPLIVAVGIGASFDKVGLLSKRLFLREIGERSSDERLAKLERDWLRKINNLGIGPGGLGGKTTALDVFIEQKPTHMATLPVAVNIGCHAIRTASKVLVTR